MLYGSQLVCTEIYMYCWTLPLAVKYILIVIVDIFNIWNKTMFFIEVYNIESEFDFHDLIRDKTMHVILVSGSVLRRRSPKPPIKSMLTLVYIAI